VPTNVRRRSIIHEFEFDSGLRRFLGSVGRADALFSDFLESLARSPERGFSVPGAPEFLGLPIHTDNEGSYLVIYWYDEDRVYCIGMRRVPSGIHRD
jgi:hypothetical protein